MERKNIELDISGIGIIFYSESNTKHIKDLEDYLSISYSLPQQVEKM